jgi:hypothetical protein
MHDKNDHNHNHRTHEIPFIADCNHFTRKNARFRAPTPSLIQTPCNIHATIANTLLPKIIISLRHQFPSSPLPIVTTSLPYHFPSLQPPSVPTSQNHHAPFVTTSQNHHIFPLSALPFVTISLNFPPPFIKINSFVIYCYLV